MLPLETKCLLMTALLYIIQEVLEGARRAIIWCFWGQAVCLGD